MTNKFEIDTIKHNNSYYAPAENGKAVKDGLVAIAYSLEDVASAMNNLAEAVKNPSWAPNPDVDV